MHVAPETGDAHSLAARAGQPPGYGQRGVGAGLPLVLAGFGQDTNAREGLLAPLPDERHAGDRPR